MTGYGADGAHAEEPEPVIRDKRRIDPQTGQVREPGAGAAGSSNPFPGRHSAPDPANPSDASQPLRVDLSAAELDIARQEAAERTGIADLAGDWIDLAIVLDDRLRFFRARAIGAVSAHFFSASSTISASTISSSCED